MTHELETQQSTPGLKEWAQAVNMASTKGDLASIETQIRNERFSSYTPKERNQLANYIDRKRKLLDEPRDTSPRATSYYSSVSALPTNEPMPEWTTSREGKNEQRVDVVIPLKGERAGEPTNPDGSANLELLRKQIKDSGELWSPDNLHENLPNTLGWAMIQYKTGPKGEKIAVVVEAQSRWGQEIRRRKNEYKQWQERTGGEYRDWETDRKSVV